MRSGEYPLSIAPWPAAISQDGTRLCTERRGAESSDKARQRDTVHNWLSKRGWHISGYHSSAGCAVPSSPASYKRETRTGCARRCTQSPRADMRCLFCFRISPDTAFEDVDWITPDTSASRRPFRADGCCRTRPGPRGGESPRRCSTVHFRQCRDASRNGVLIKPRSNTSPTWRQTSQVATRSGRSYLHHSRYLRMIRAYNSAS